MSLTMPSPVSCTPKLGLGFGLGLGLGLATPTSAEGSPLMLPAACLLQMLQRVLRKEGPTGLYRGMAITYIRDFPSSGVYFCCYEALKAWLDPPDPRGSARGDAAWAMWIAGGTAGCLSWLSVYPLDVVKSRVQASSSSTSPYAGVSPGGGRGGPCRRKHMLRTANVQPPASSRTHSSLPPIPYNHTHSTTPSTLSHTPLQARWIVRCRVTGQRALGFSSGVSTPHWAGPS
jgi:hypothetical protein